MLNCAGSTPCPVPAIRHPSFLVHHLPFVRGAMASYALALLILGFGVLAVWVWQFSGPQWARQSGDRGRVLTRSRGGRQAAKIVGKITTQGGPFWVSDPGIAARPGGATGVWPAPQPSDVARLRGVGGRQWFDAKAVAGEPTDVPAGRAYFLHAGSLEITYRSGTKIVLHGPAVFVAGEENGFVSYGWASVQVRRPKGAKTGLPGEDATSAADQAGSQARFWQVPSPRRGVPSADVIAAHPQFTLRTGIAILTSQSGDFDVAVDDLAASFTRVTRGRVALQFPGERPGEAKLIRTDRGAFVAYWAEQKAITARWPSRARAFLSPRAPPRNPRWPRKTTRHRKIGHGTARTGQEVHPIPENSGGSDLWRPSVARIEPTVGGGLATCVLSVIFDQCDFENPKGKIV